MRFHFLIRQRAVLPKQELLAEHLINLVHYDVQEDRILRHIVQLGRQFSDILCFEHRILQMLSERVVEQDAYKVLGVVILLLLMFHLAADNA